MISERIMKTAEKCIPAEKRFIEFWNKRPHRLILSGIIAVLFGWLSYEHAARSGSNLFWDILLGIVLAVPTLTAVGAFFGTITKFSKGIYIASACAMAVLMIFALSYVLFVACADFSRLNSFETFTRWSLACAEQYAITILPSLAAAILPGVLVSKPKREV